MTIKTVKATFPDIVVVTLKQDGTMTLITKNEEVYLGETAYLRVDIANEEIEKISDFNNRLDGFLKAFPEEMFTPFTDEEKEKVMGALKYCEVHAATDRLHADWGRHITLSLKDALKD
ncbi:MAG: hypothetical protein ACC707_14890 [Thiohalomonadales bacterium]